MATTVQLHFLNRLAVYYAIHGRTLHGGKVFVLLRQGKFLSIQICPAEVPWPNTSAVDQEQSRKAQQRR